MPYYLSTELLGKLADSFYFARAFSVRVDTYAKREPSFSTPWGVNPLPNAPASTPFAASAESYAGIGFAACAGKHYFVIGTKAAFLAYPC